MVLRGECAPCLTRCLGIETRNALATIPSGTSARGERRSPRSLLKTSFRMSNTVHQSIENLIQRVRGEYLEMPGLRLTGAQASRLWDLDRTTCQRLLNVLLDMRFLTRSDDGRYRRAEF